jgi:hypothetical protein
MSKFKKVSEIENIPSFIEKKFVGASYDVVEDPYAELKNNSANNRNKIAKQTVGMQKEAQSFDRSWETIQGPSVYAEPTYSFRQESEDSLNPNAIRRAGSTFDEGLNARTTTSGLKAYSADEYMNAMLSRSASIFNPDMIAISEEFLNSQESSSQQAVVNDAQRREARASKHNTWQEEKLNSLRKSSVVSNRAHSVLRTSNEAEYSSQWGMIDPDQLDQREFQKVAMQEKSRQNRMGVKKNHTEDLENRAVNKAQTIHDIYNNVNINLDIDKF